VSGMRTSDVDVAGRVCSVCCVMLVEGRKRKSAAGTREHREGAQGGAGPVVDDECGVREGQVRRARGQKRKLLKMAQIRSRCSPSISAKTVVPCAFAGR
jgi:hypothetical protein